MNHMALVSPSNYAFFKTSSFLLIVSERTIYGAVSRQQEMKTEIRKRRGPNKEEGADGKKTKIKGWEVAGR